MELYSTNLYAISHHVKMTQNAGSRNLKSIAFILLNSDIDKCICPT